MPKIKVSSKGQIAIPKQIRERLRIQQGDSMMIEERKGELILKPLKKSLLDLGGTLHRKGVRRATDEEIRRAAEQATIKKYRKRR